MLIELKKLLEVQFPNRQSEIGNLNSSCCASNKTIVFDFDGITEDFFKEIKVGDILKSVDALYFCTDKKQLFFIEMKSFRNHASVTGNVDSQACLTFVRNHLIAAGNDNIRQKIIHSIFTILKIIKHYKVNADFYSYFLEPKTLSVKNYFVLDITYDEYMFLELSNLDKILKNRIEGEIDILNCEGLEAKLAS